MTVADTIKQTVTTNNVVLFMKGTKSMPQCGFSSRVAGVLNFMGVEFADVNVLADEEIRQGIKDYSDWPTVPQLYVKGEFVGGCDIITEMMLSGELDTLFTASDVAFDKAAADKIREANATSRERIKMGSFKMRITLETCISKTLVIG
jgi:monothiol glutaredoxin